MDHRILEHAPGATVSMMPTKSCQTSRCMRCPSSLRTNTDAGLTRHSLRYCPWLEVSAVTAEVSVRPPTSAVRPMSRSILRPQNPPSSCRNSDVLHQPGDGQLTITRPLPPDDPSTGFATLAASSRVHCMTSSLLKKYRAAIFASSFRLSLSKTLPLERWRCTCV